MTRLVDWFVQAGATLGRLVEPNFMLLLSDGRKLNSLVRVPDIGATNGMLVFEDYESISQDIAELAALGYGYSIMDEPRLDEKFDLELFKEVFADWAGGATLA